MKKSTLSAIAAVSVVGALAVGLGAVTDWFTNWKPSTWFGRGDNAVVVPNNPGSYGDTQDGAIMSGGQGAGVSIVSEKLPRDSYATYGVDERADTAYTLKATVTPSNATNKAVDWTVRWVDAENSFASGHAVTEYVTVTPTSDGALTAVVECKQAFGAQIQVVCTLRDNSSLSATCTVDYTEKIIDAKLGFEWYENFGMVMWFNPYEYAYMNVGEPVVIQFFGNKPSGDGYGNYYSQINKTVGTISDSYFWDIELPPSLSAYEAVPHYGNSGKYECKNMSTEGMNKRAHSYCPFSVENMNEIFSYDVRSDSNFLKAFAAGDFDSEGPIKVKLTVRGEYSEYKYTSNFTFAPGQLNIPASNVSLDNGSIIF